MQNISNQANNDEFEILETQDQQQQRTIEEFKQQILLLKNNLTMISKQKLQVESDYQQIKVYYTNKLQEIQQTIESLQVKNQWLNDQNAHLKNQLSYYQTIKTSKEDSFAIYQKNQEQEKQTMQSIIEGQSQEITQLKIEKNNLESQQFITNSEHSKKIIEIQQQIKQLEELLDLEKKKNEKTKVEMEQYQAIIQSIQSPIYGKESQLKNSSNINQLYLSDQKWELQMLRNEISNYQFILENVSIDQVLEKILGKISVQVAEMKKINLSIKDNEITKNLIKSEMESIFDHVKQILNVYSLKLTFKFE